MTASGLSPTRWAAALKREWLLYHLSDPRFRFMWDAPPDNEWVALDCETTGLNVKTDDIIAIGAVRIAGATGKAASLSDQRARAPPA